jgi:hypothetical protein
VLSFCDQHVNPDHIVTNPVLVSVFGLVVQTPLTAQKPDGDPENTYKLDAYTVEDFGSYARLTCSCGRSDPEWVATEDLARSHRVSGRFACPTCIQEDRDARSPSDQVSAWLAQNRIRVNAQDHLFLPKQFQRLVDRDGTIMRPRRFVFSKFYDIELATRDKVLPTCGCEDCVNPYHMMRTLSPATKVTPQMKEDVRLWLTKKFSNKTIQLLLEAKYNCQLSLRTITNLKKSVLV